ncbi:unnamed protein product [Acanthoscelides obtectus]|uniref:C2H2-type domain-containing protein n=1 Tax=Acanthoscelides obtectus TaxID=200917 RepID=A0A9P0KWY7_ACAOB|nr:unnamed protein product [Acanthoscelides obtectus]CAK1676175.1 hypothetical protein AOBTE_LOCUS30632 [Acanthoscelides obtectus]
MLFENVDTLALNDIKYEYDEDAISDLTCDRIQIEEKFFPGIEADWTAGTADQMEMGYENTDALELHQEFDIKTEGDQNDGHDSASDRVRLKKDFKRKHEYSIDDIERNNSYLGSVSGKLCKPNEYVCIKCNDVFKSVVLLDNHVIRKHVDSIATVTSKIHECTFCDYKTVFKRYFTGHMLMHTNTKVSDLHICKYCNTSFKAKQSFNDHILKNHPNFGETVSRTIHECMHCAFKTTRKGDFIKHLANHNSETPFACINCDSVFKSQVLLDNHVIRKHAESAASVSSKIHECTFCDYKTVVKRYLTGHMWIHNDNKVSDLHVCKHCNARFEENQSFLAHFLKNDPNSSGTDSNKVYECIHCDFKTTARSSFVRHAENHNSKKRFECTNCDATFKSVLLLDNHLIRKHVDSIASVSSKILECTYCDYKTVFKRYLTGHMLMHTNTKVYDLHICKYCNTSFKSKQSFIDHILKKHPNLSGTVSRKIYECMHCAFKTTRRSDFIKHLANHNSQKPFECINCDSVFKSKVLLDNHVIRKHADSAASVSSKIHECTFCDYKTVVKRYLTGHMLIHNDNKVPDLNICKHCNAAFKAKQSLFGHILKKHPNFSRTVSNKIYECIHCEFKTAGRSSFVRHMANHNSTKAFECSNCDAAFKSKMLLDNHVIRKHAESIASVSSKIHECGFCDYKTVVKRYLNGHMSVHSVTKVSDLHVCKHCNASFKAKQSFIDHILKKHPNFSWTVCHKIYECMHCAFKITSRSHFIKHVAKHNSQMPFACANCDSVFKSKILLDNHVIRKHAESVASVSSKILECRFCDYKTVIKRYLTGHLLIHSDNKVSDLHVCKHCNASFKAKQSLLDHILKKHPDFSGTVSHKIYECVHCDFKTTRMASFKTHMAKYSEKLFACINCEAAFKSKMLLDNHVIRKHVDSIASVSSEIYECTFCDYKTSLKHYLTGHMIKHTNAKASGVHICQHCNMSFKAKQSLLNHFLKQHPNFSGTVSSKIYECIHCTYKTTGRRGFLRHMANHDSQNDASFKTKLHLDHHVLKKHPERIASVSRKILECTQCEYKTARADNLARHSMKHNRAKLTCTKCDELFTKKHLLDNHVLQKHPDLVASMSRKIHECTQCEYKTTRADYLARHMMEHTRTNLACTKCNASFTKKQLLDNHILQKHPELIASVSSKIHECTHCEYKTTHASNLAIHIMKHTGTKFTCTKCDASFTSKQSLDNHILQKHPELTASVSSKIHECIHCEFKTLNTKHLAAHTMKHTGAKLTCTKCDASFTNKQSLDNHILQKHPELIASVTSKIHECVHCEYKTIYAKHLPIHTMKHTGAKLTCTECDASFMYKQTLQNHMLQKHPEFIDSVSSKIHVCTHCEYKTIRAPDLAEHIMKHIGVKFPCAKCDAVFTRKRTLDCHISRKHPEFTTVVSITSSSPVTSN